MCKKEKVLLDFYKQKFGDGYTAACKTCKREYGKHYAKKNIEKVREKNKEYRKNHKEELNTYSKNWRAQNPERIKENNIKKFGITFKEYSDMLVSQNGVCAICKRKESMMSNNGKSVKDFCVDHCHSTGRVRGLLCNKCNSAIGYMDDNPNFLRNAIIYLEEN